MQLTNKTTLLIAAFVILVALGAYLMYRSQNILSLTPFGQTATTTTSGATSTVAARSGDIQILTTAQAYVMQARDQKNAGNYAGAIATLNKALVIDPKDVVVNNNLGDLYMFFAKDYVQAEAAYKRVLASDPKYLDAYRHLLDLYTTTSYKPTNTAAADIVAAALKVSPNAYDLQVVLARWYRDTHNYAQAKAEYQLALDNAKRQNLTTAAAQIEAELKALPQ